MPAIAKTCSYTRNNCRRQSQSLSDDLDLAVFTFNRAASIALGRAARLTTRWTTTTRSCSRTSGGTSRAIDLLTNALHCAFEISGRAANTRSVAARKGIANTFYAGLDRAAQVG